VSSLLTKQIQAETFPDGVPVRSRYLRVQQVLDWYPFKRAKLYELLASGKIKSFLLKERGALRGCRLVDRDSLDDFLQAASEQADKEASLS
jgi:hypothetical protein